MLRRTASQTAGPIGLNFFVLDLMDGQGVLFEICFFSKFLFFYFFVQIFFHVKRRALQLVCIYTLLV